MIFADGLPIGGQHITNDIARGLTTTFAHAERLKTLYGSSVLSALDEREIIDVPQVGEESPGFSMPGRHAGDEGPGFSNHMPKWPILGFIPRRLAECLR
jgi:cell division protein FtsA